VGSALGLGSLLLDNAELNTLALGEGDSRAVLVTDDKGSTETGSENVAVGVLHIDNIEGTLVDLAGLKDTNTTSVLTAGDHDKLANIELEDLSDLARLEVVLDGVVDLDERVRVADGAAIVGGDHGDLVGADADSGDLAELELGLSIVNRGEGEAALGVVQEAELLLGLVDGDNIHETSGEAGVSADLAVNLHKAAHANRESLLAGQSVLETLTEDEDNREGVTEGVGAGAGAGGPDTAQLVEHPVLGGIEPLKVLLGAASLLFISHSNISPDR